MTCDLRPVVRGCAALKKITGDYVAGYFREKLSVGNM
jgi:hypothetical protein